MKSLCTNASGRNHNKISLMPLAGRKLSARFIGPRLYAGFNTLHTALRLPASIVYPPDCLCVAPKRARVQNPASHSSESLLFCLCAIILALAPPAIRRTSPRAQSHARVPGFAAPINVRLKAGVPEHAHAVRAADHAGYLHLSLAQAVRTLFLPA